MSLPAAAVCLDAQGVQSHDHHDRGIARYIVEHVRALHRLRPDALSSVLLNPTLPLSGSLNWLLSEGLLGWTSSDRRTTGHPPPRASIYHVMSPFELQHTIDELWPGWARGSGTQTVVTLYDLIPMVFPEHYLRDPVIRTRYKTRATLVQRADHVLAISQTTAEDAIEHLHIDPARITVVNAGATEKFAGMHSTATSAWKALGRRLSRIRPGFMLYVAGFEFRKNLERVIAAFGLMPRVVRESHQLVIACRMLPSEAEMLHGWARQAGIDEGQLLVTGYVNDAELGALYHACALFVFASLYEGSGLPILEAMSCGTPVAASNTSTAPEILGDMRATFDPYDPASIAECLSGVIGSPSALETLAERSRRRVGRYTWGAVAERTLEAYERVLADGGRGAHRRRRRRPRIALVSPWPPERSGIADYSLRLARELGAMADVDVVVGQELDRYAPPQERGVRLVSARSFRLVETLRQPDRVVYCMGNSSFHGHVYELLRQRPGAVVAHDVRLTGFYGWFAGVERPDDPAGRLSERINALYGARLPRSALADGPPDWERQSALGIYMTGEIQQYAEELLVHSRYAQNVLELDRPVLDRQASTRVATFGMPPIATPEPTTGALGDAPMIVSVGVVSEVKGLATLITAVSQLAEDRPRARLVIAGPGDEQELDRWRTFAAETARQLDIQIPGHLSTQAYRRLLHDADLAVQLRTLSNGEASAAVADCLSAGLPTVVTDIGWGAELPGDAARRVPLDVAPAELAATLEELIGDVQTRRSLSAGAQRHADACSFSNVADEYLRILELA